MFVRIKTLLRDFDKGQNYIYVPGSFPPVETEVARPDSEVTIPAETTPADSEHELRAS